ncbi:MAG: 50S ribosomal protein L13 [Fimbriimonadales bacterium]|nr:MAG: 50S ribosomal protein L13 [Armatimonadota bacterium]MBV6502669.1 50S ribosomal protein L13 [Fimbriimonadales bacterium]MCE7898483.1 50S ribosomal protein L13 [Armatimonadetes bacterium ATM1]MDL1928224.1 50S ribosomal protein L13 [Fimbriimonadia bacterium ATM]MBC6968678.1 50S ribosomal protein L13 [Armatimonadota bacterium]
MSTYSVKSKDIERKWYVVDATNQPVGRIAAAVAQVLRGKNKPTFAYNQDVGDHVIVINAEKARLTGNNKKDELIHHHTGWPGGLRAVSRGTLLESKPEKLIYRAVWGMLPKHRLGHEIIKKLKVYRGPDHPHAAQNPIDLNLGD